MSSVLSVLGVHPFRIGGVETLARELSLQLHECGCRSILCFQSEPRYHVREFLSLPNVEFDILKDPSGAGMRTSLELSRILRRHRPEIVHFHFTSPQGPFPWIAKLCGAEQIFYTDHGSAPEGYLQRALPAWKKILGRIPAYPLTRVFCASNYNCRRILVREMAPLDRCETLHNSVDLDRVRGTANSARNFRARYSIPGDRAIVLQIGVIAEQKGVPDLLEAARLILEKTDRVQFVFAGDGPSLEDYRQSGVNMGIDDHLTWTGLVEDPFREGVFSAADLVCQVSRWQEAFGWTIAEAMAHSKPLVATHVGGIPEVVQHGRTGFLVPRRDARAIADRILQLLEDPLLRSAMGQMGQKRVASNFDIRRYVARLLECYGLSPEFSHAKIETMAVSN